MPIATRVVALPVCAALVTLTAACGGAAATGGSRACALRSSDSVFTRSGPVYRDCAVDRPVQLRTRDVRPDFMPPSREGCYSAVIEFVVDTMGLVELSTARIARTNDATFAQSLMAVLPRYRYDPARVGGRPVRQIATVEQAIATRRVVVAAGASPPPPPSGRGGC